MMNRLILISSMVVLSFIQAICQVNPDLINLPDNTWKKMNPTFDPPGLGNGGFGHPHDESQITFDEAGGVVVWFGGCSAGYTNQTWLYSVTHDRWTEGNPLIYEDENGIEKPGPMTWDLKICHSLPRGQCNFGICYNSDAAVCIKHVGISSGWTEHQGELFNEVTFSYNGSTKEWQKVARWDGNTYSSTYTLASYGLAYDSKFKKIIMFGGSASTVCGFTACDLTYAFDINTGVWERRMPAQKPPKCKHHNVTYLKKYGKILALVSGQTWLYDYGENTWTKVCSGPSVSKAAMCYDSNNDVVILFKSGSTWIYKPEQNTWQSMNPSPSPSSNKVWQLAFDPKNNVAVVVSGYDTWVYRYKNVSSVGTDQKDRQDTHYLKVTCTPHPVNSHSVIGYFLKGPGKANLSIYDLGGCLVRQLADRFHAQGNHTIKWDGSDTYRSRIPSGLYVIRLKTRTLAISRIILLNK
jgi:hypothetical protein